MDFPNCNSTIYDDYTDDQLGKMKLFKGYPDGLVMFTVVCCGVYMLVGIPGNLITIIALARCKKIQNATTVFIMNLACSDMLFCCFNLPLISATYWQQHWPFGMTVCRMFPMTGYGLVAVSLLTILGIMINRYILIAHPRLYTKIYKARYIAAMIASTWILSFGILIPTWLEKWGRFGMDSVIGSCSILPDCNNQSPKKFLFIGAFLIPCLLVLICYLRIFCIVRKSAKRISNAPKQKGPQLMQKTSTISSESTSHVSIQKSQDARVETALNTSLPANQKVLLDKETSPSTMSSLDGNCLGNAENRTKFGNNIFKRVQQSFALLKRAGQPLASQLSSKDRTVLHMIMTIIISFWVCYLPITFIKLFRDFSVPPVLRVIGYLLVYLTTCINPIIYVMMSSEYRQAYRNLFMRDAPNTRRALETKDPGQRISVAQIYENRKSHVLTAV